MHGHRGPPRNYTKAQTMDVYTIWVISRDWRWVKKLILRGYMLCVSIHVIVLKWQDYGNRDPAMGASDVWWGQGQEGKWAWSWREVGVATEESRCGHKRSTWGTPEVRKPETVCSLIASTWHPSFKIIPESELDKGYMGPCWIISYKLQENLQGPQERIQRKGAGKASWRRWHLREDLQGTLLGSSLVKARLRYSLEGCRGRGRALSRQRWTLPSLFL